MAVSRQRFESGLIYAQWLEAMSVNQARFLQNVERTTFTAEDVAFFRGLRAPLNVLVIAEPWCGDVVNNLPILIRLAAEAAGKLNVRIFLRDANLDVTDQFLNQGKYRSIPTIVFLDESLREIGRWHERPKISRATQADACLEEWRQVIGAGR